MRNVVLLLVAVAMFGACSLKEERGVCPCWLTVDTDGRQMLVSAWSSGRYFRGETVSGVREYELERGFLALSAVSPSTHIMDGDNLVIELRCQADSVYGQSMTVDYVGDEYLYKVQPFKQFATLTMTLDVDEGDIAPEYDAVVRGNTCGWNLKTFQGVSGAFEYEPVREDGKRYTFRVPRQLDDSLEMDLVIGSVVMRTVRIGELVRTAGYNWNEDNLQDIEMLIDLERSTVQIDVNGWENAVVMEITI